LFTRISAFVIIGIGIAKPGIADGDYRQKKLPEFLYRHGRGDHGLLTKEMFQNRTALIRIKSDPAIFPRVFRGSLVSGACACRDIKCLSGVEPVFLMLRPKRAGSFKNKMNQMVWLHLKAVCISCTTGRNPAVVKLQRKIFQCCPV
jgi:hypothetical protein